MKPINEVKNSTSRNLFIFDHGLGDFIHYLPVHKEFERQTQIEISIAAPKSRQFNFIYPKIYDSETIEPRKFGLIYKIRYPDTKSFVLPFEIYDEPSKPYLCAYYELGMSFFVWSPFKIKTSPVKNSKRVGVHFFGMTGVNEKYCPISVAKMIWNDIIKAGFEPFECHMQPGFRKKYTDCSDNTCDFIEQHQTIRYQKSDLKLMMDEISKCHYFIGVDSGPLYLAATIIGYDNVIGLENKKRISYYSPKHISSVSVREYQEGTIYQRLTTMEDQHD